MPDKKVGESKEREKKVVEKKEIVGNVKRPEEPESRRSRRPTYQHG